MATITRTQPSLEANLAAVVLYGTVYKPASLTVPFRGKLPESDATVLQTLAAEALGDAGNRREP